MRRSTFLTAAVAGIIASQFLTAVRPTALAHCEIPCGIYNDVARIQQMLEDTTTVGRAVDQIMALAGQTDAQSMNQVTRWTMNKEDHATRIQHTIAQYYLTQRVKPVAKGSQGWNDYVAKLADHHAVMVAAMKCKQTVDPEAVEMLRMAIVTVGQYYTTTTHPTSAPRGR